MRATPVAAATSSARRDIARRPCPSAPSQKPVAQRPSKELRRSGTQRACCAPAVRSVGSKRHPVDVDRPAIGPLQPADERRSAVDFPACGGAGQRNRLARAMLRRRRRQPLAQTRKADHGKRRTGHGPPAPAQPFLRLVRRLRTAQPRSRATASARLVVPGGARSRSWLEESGASISRTLPSARSGAWPGAEAQIRPGSAQPA